MKTVISNTSITTRPYVLRAFYDWVLDHQWTPHLVVNCDVEGVSVPSQHIDSEGKIILNIGTKAVQSLCIANETVEFDACFSGVVTHVYVPMIAVDALYTRETGQGVMFIHEDGDDEETKKSKEDVPYLRLVE